jgi:glycine/D-amino acid oxidase-like deaminating enzyme
VERFDAAVVGAGVFGVRLALLLARAGRQVALLESRGAVAERATYANQARVHHGYHYPRSLATAAGAKANYPRFLREMAECVVTDCTALYAVARQGSAISAAQFVEFCRRLDLPCAPAAPRLRRLFDEERVEAVLSVAEAAFDGERLRRRLAVDLGAEPRVKLFLDRHVQRLVVEGPAAVLVTAAGHVRAPVVFLAAYAGINALLAASGLERLPLKSELCEICLVGVPDVLRKLAITVVDGAFFSLTPMPARAAHALTHVRYTPHAAWTAERDAVCGGTSRFLFMRKDAERYLPAAAEVQHQGSLFEVKALPLRHEIDDGRPILVTRHCQVPLCASVLGAKIDSMFELEAVITALTGDVPA